MNFSKISRKSIIKCPLPWASHLFRPLCIRPISCSTLRQPAQFNWWHGREQSKQRVNWWDKKHKFIVARASVYDVACLFGCCHGGLHGSRHDGWRYLQWPRKYHTVHKSWPLKTTAPGFKWNLTGPCQNKDYISMCRDSQLENKTVITLTALPIYCKFLTHLPLDKMAPISQTSFSNAFPWMKSSAFWYEFHWSLLLRVQLTKSQHWFR